MDGGRNTSDAVVGRSAAASELYFLLFFLKFLQPGLRLLLLYSNLKTVLKKKLMNSCRSTNLYPNKRHKKKERSWYLLWDRRKNGRKTWSCSSPLSLLFSPSKGFRSGLLFASVWDSGRFTVWFVSTIPCFDFESSSSCIDPVSIWCFALQTKLCMLLLKVEHENGVCIKWIGLCCEFGSGFATVTNVVTRFQFIEKKC